MDIFIIIAVAGFVIVLPIVLYIFSRMSRRSYRCPSCGEELRTEYLHAKNCNMCGASLEQREY